MFLTQEDNGTFQTKEIMITKHVLIYDVVVARKCNLFILFVCCACCA